MPACASRTSRPSPGAERRAAGIVVTETLPTEKERDPVLMRSFSWKLAGWVYGAAVGVYALDRLTKALAEDRLPAHPVKLIPGVLQLTYTTNRGGAFGLFGNAPYLFLGATLVVCAAIVVASFSTSYRILAVGLG